MNLYGKHTMTQLNDSENEEADLMYNLELYLGNFNTFCDEILQDAEPEREEQKDDFITNLVSENVEDDQPKESETLIKHKEKIEEFLQLWLECVVSANTSAFF